MEKRASNRIYLICGWLIIVVSKAIGKRLLMRKEDHYDS